jgi:hypothetical protein
MNLKGCVSKRMWSNFNVLSRTVVGETEENHDIISQDIRCSGRDMKPGPPEYEAGMLTTRPQRSFRKVGYSDVVLT